MSTAPDARTPRYLGAAFVFQFATSLAAGLLTASMLAGGISEVLTDVFAHQGQLRASIVLELLTSVGIVVMSSLLYVVLGAQSRSAALVALGLWMAEAVMLAVKALGLYALLTLGQAHVGAATDASSERMLGTLWLGLSRHAADIAMLFFCLGALVWYALFLRSRVVPRPLALWGLVAVPLVLVATLMLVWDRNSDPSKILYAPYVPFELVVGLWLLVKGGGVATTPPDYGSAPDAATEVTGREAGTAVSR